MPENPEIKNNPENTHPCEQSCLQYASTCTLSDGQEDICREWQEKG